MKLVTLSDIRSGMILSKDVVNDLGIVFLSKGMTLSETHIEALRKLEVDFVYIEDGEEELSINKPEESLENTYKRAIIIIKSIYHSVRVGRNIDVVLTREQILPMIKKIAKHNDILSVIRKIECEDTYIYKHSVNVAIFACMIGKWMKLSQETLDDLALAGFFHDIGKCKVSLEILNKPRDLTFEEFVVAKRHSEMGYEILKRSGIESEAILEGVLYHHERLNGIGYPNELKGDQIPLFARIIGVADVFDAITSNKTYKGRISVYAGARVLKDESFNKLDPEITNIFVKNISRFYVGNNVKLNTGETGEVILLNKYDVTRPLIRAGEKYYDLSSNYDIDIVEVLRN